ncbi:MAG: tyrosine-type recombinase/integrase [Thermotogota bacterium]|nr:tyrosine-type recombinase/integrase [Thermotogota bacterium]
MNRTVFKSVFAEDINEYLDEKVRSGYSEKSFYYHLKCFDRFCRDNELETKEFNQPLADEWVKIRPAEASTTHYSRINAMKWFLIFLHNKGYKVRVTRDVAFKPTDFKPHIYTKDEIRRYFESVDRFDSSRNKRTKIQYPLLFRLLYCCGTRINETLGIRKCDVDLEAGIIKLFEVKNNCERYIVLNDELLDLMQHYANKTFYLLSETDYIFRSTRDSRYHGATVYEHHRLILKKAGIPYIGDGKGPRVHDWRHTFAVTAFKKMIDEGLDMYVALPVLSTYLGHKTINATEKYVRLTMEIYPFIEEQFKDKMNAVFGEVHHEAD